MKKLILSFAVVVIAFTFLSSTEIRSNAEEKDKTEIKKEKEKKKKKKSSKFFKKKEELEEVSIEDLEELGVYRPIKEYPESMNKFFGPNKNFIMRTKKAGAYMSNNFSRTKIWAQRKPGNLMKAMAMYEIFYLGRLRENKGMLERYKKNWPNKYFRKKTDESAIRSLKGMNKGRKKMRAALGMDLELPIEDAIKRFWVLGEFLSLGEPKKLAELSPEIKKRSKILQDYKNAIAQLKGKLEEDAEKTEKKATETK
jgi:hypothetical protein